MNDSTCQFYYNVNTCYKPYKTNGRGWHEYSYQISCLDSWRSGLNSLFSPFQINRFWGRREILTVLLTSTVGARIPNIRIPNPFQNRTFLCSNLEWLGFRMVSSSTIDIWFRPFKIRTFHASLGRFINIILFYLYIKRSRLTAIWKLNKMATILFSFRMVKETKWLL